MVELTPFQAAKKRNEPYIKLVIDTRHCKVDPKDGNHRNRIEVEGPISWIMRQKALTLWQEIAADTQDDD